MEDTRTDEELSAEALADLMGEYKKELARLYKLASAKRALLASRGESKELLAKCDADMREDISELKKKYGIHY
jgi:hypothetical protein